MKNIILMNNIFLMNNIILMNNKDIILLKIKQLILMNNIQSRLKLRL